MGFFDIFLSDEKLIQKNVRRLINRDATPEDREASARWLADKEGQQAMVGLLRRFDMKLDHQLKDKGEREFLYSLVLSRGEEAVEPLRVWLRGCKQVAQPLKLLGELAGVESQREMAIELLNLEIERDDFKPDKKKALLIWLVGTKDTSVLEPVSTCLTDFDEGVRFSAVEVLISQPADNGRKALEQVFTNEREDSNRLKIRVAEAFVKRRWSISDSAGGALPDGFAFRDGRVAKA